MGQSYAVLVINKEVSVKICCLLRAVQLVTSPGKLCFFGMKNSRSLNAACISIANHNFKSCQCLVYACFFRLWFFKKKNLNYIRNSNVSHLLKLYKPRQR